MPVGRTNNPCICDDCGELMPANHDAYLDLDTEKIYCLDCRTVDGEVIERPPVVEPPSGPKTVIVRHESSKVDDLKRENARLRAELKDLKASYKTLQKHARALLDIQKGLVRGKKPKQLTLTEERLRLRGK